MKLSETGEGPRKALERLPGWILAHAEDLPMGFPPLFLHMHTDFIL